MTIFEIPRRIEEQYQRAIRRILLPEIPKKEPEESIQDWLKKLAGISEKRDLADAAAWIAGQMVRWVAADNEKSWRAASAKAQRSRMLYRLLQQEMAGPVGVKVRSIVEENARLISRIPLEVSERLTADVLKMQQAGARPETVMRFLRERFPSMAKWKIKVIGRTETAKASTALTRARAEELDLPFYVWETSRDTRVRPSHKNLQGVLIAFDDPPQPEALIHEHSTLGKGAPGEFPNCRCHPRVVLTLDDVTWPVRMYASNRINYITREQFRNRYGVTEERAA